MHALTEGLEDYLEAILVCESEHRFVRTKHIAEKMNVSSPSAHAAVKELAKMGLVEHESYGYIELTSEGRNQAEKVYSKHKVLFRFFRDFLGLPDDTSEANACGIEHHFDDLTTKRFRRVFEFLLSKIAEDKDFEEELKKALKND
ncbi:hypothetical protein GF359_02695 [candidate division WOR-3 bacterium]|uniref:HTH dtxR-type domain-containing protein n=1 Tax=candidate division WOR-3 bacterium TaxID=2052148 RepID=A0A9D5K883_UNCW3|nr:hypothetical protein [candidate division WOR-3 bacterium]MBD3364102.1 hypothetical protein [candidate division WOR-3 bacterium]